MVRLIYYNQSWNQSCTVFASLYCKPRVARDGNNELYEEFPTNFSTDGNVSLHYFRFW